MHACVCAYVYGWVVCVSKLSVGMLVWRTEQLWLSSPYSLYETGSLWFCSCASQANQPVVVLALLPCLLQKCRDYMNVLLWQALCGFWEKTQVIMLGASSAFLAKPSLHLPVNLYYHYYYYYSIFRFILYVWMFCLHAYLCTTCMPAAPENTGFPEIWVWMVLSHCEGARNQTGVLCKISKYS